MKSHPQEERMRQRHLQEEQTQRLKVRQSKIDLYAEVVKLVDTLS